MQAEIMRGDDLKREVWRFALDVDSRSYLWLRCYQFEVKPTKRHKWQVSLWWDRYDNRDSKLSTPPLPPDVVQEAKDIFKAMIDKLEVTL